MTDKNEIPVESKIIIGTEYFEKTGWFSLHLHDALYAVSFRPNQQRVVIAEGRGPDRLRHFRLPFENIVRFEAVEVPIGHNCVAAPIDADQLGENDQIPEDKPFSPIMIRVLIKHSTRHDLISIHDLGATPTPIIVPLLRNIPQARLENANISLSNANDCFRLAREVVEWVDQVNERLDQATGRELALAVGKTTDAEDSYHEEIKRICAGVNCEDSNVRQTLYRAVAEICFSSFIHTRLSKERRLTGIAKAERVCIPALSKDKALKEVVVEDLFEAGKSYHKKTGRPFTEVLDAISGQVSFLKDSPASTAPDPRDSNLQEEEAKPIKINDPGRLINEQRRVWTGVGLKHEEQLLKVFENEGVEVHYLAGLPFLSLLMNYETADGEINYAVVIREGLHQALKEFLLAHELGHFFLQVKPGNFSARYAQLDHLRSSSQRFFLEMEADSFGMKLLFPPNYLADLIIFHKQLSADVLLEDFLSGMDPVSDRLRLQMRRYVEEHIDEYNKFKKAEEPAFLTLEVKRIEQKQLPALLDLIQQTREDTYWVTLTKDSRIEIASPNSNELFGVPPKRLKGLTPVQLVVPEEVEPMRRRAEYRKTEKEAIYYFTEVVNKELNTSRQVIVYSFPILHKGEYVGAVAVLRLLDEPKTESLFPNFPRLAMTAGDFEILI